MKKIIIVIILIIPFTSYTQCWKQIHSLGHGKVAINDSNICFVWGSNSFGQVGNNTTTTVNVNYPTRTNNDTDWFSVSGTCETILALKTDSTLWAWGNNWNGQVGDSTIYQNALTPRNIAHGSKWINVSGHCSHSLGIQKDRSLWVWGSNSNNQLGLGNLANAIVPTQLGADLDWKQVSAGGKHSMAIKTNGTLWAWGYNLRGEIGNGTLMDAPTMIQVGSDSDWRYVFAGGYTTFAIKNDNSLWAWGSNGSSDPLGVGTTGNILVPTQLGTDTNWKIVGQHYGLKNDSTIWFWGSSNFPVPVLYDTTYKWTSVSKGISAINSEGELFAYGLNLVSCDSVDFSLEINNIEKTKEHITIYPNPALNDLFIKTEIKIREISIFDLQGKLVIQSETSNSKINTESLNSGLYFIRVKTESSIITEKIVIKK